MVFKERAWEPQPTPTELPPRAEEMFTSPEMPEEKPDRAAHEVAPERPDSTDSKKLETRASTKELLAGKPAEVVEQVHVMEAIQTGLRAALQEADLAHLLITDQMFEAALQGHTYVSHSPDGMIVTVTPDAGRAFVFHATAVPDPDFKSI